MNTTSFAEIKGLQNKLRYITVDMEDRAVCDDQQYNELVKKFTDVIELLITTWILRIALVHYMTQ